MYKYTVKPSILEVLEPCYQDSKYVGYGSFVRSIKPYIPDAVDNKTYYYYLAFREIWGFCFYSKTELQTVYLNGVGFPVEIFKVEEI